eukprot:CAMPEP_0181204432 /NCGR_PEP_ID=MMETSP1096-20121128/19933_1 /TAXON_ID=156174 ORGANISM="Chrysochromulina ericina, Strain CCMP281" /NCGR_SAMPLE_ID=MMETSP1096 /ASSEMBLY_ACC=CAM_ASM_000453 /LENGTH=60 /DNA_ID=CAMNT_0023295133 /DNA_START=23 /DNA_END=205 /DNA_ORIENTATION=-
MEDAPISSSDQKALQKFVSANSKGLAQLVKRDLNEKPPLEALGMLYWLKSQAASKWYWPF